MKNCCRAKEENNCRDHGAKADNPQRGNKPFRPINDLTHEASFRESQKLLPEGKISPSPSQGFDESRLADCGS
jgi:hypothetical protein